MKNKEMKRRKAKVKSKKSIDIYVIHNEINLLFHGYLINTPYTPMLPSLRGAPKASVNISVIH